MVRSLLLAALAPFCLAPASMRAARALDDKASAIQDKSRKKNGAV